MLYVFFEVCLIIAGLRTGDSGWFIAAGVWELAAVMHGGFKLRR